MKTITIPVSNEIFEQIEDNSSELQDYLSFSKNELLEKGIDNLVIYTKIGEIIFIRETDCSSHTNNPQSPETLKE